MAQLRLGRHLATGPQVYLRGVGKSVAAPPCFNIRARIRLVATANSSSSSPDSPPCVYTTIDVLLAKLESDPAYEAQAVSLAAERKRTGELRAFGSLTSGAGGVPKRIYTIEELRLNGIRAEQLLSPIDGSLGKVRNIAQGAALAGLGALAFTSQDMGQVLATVVGVAFALVFDQVANQGGGEALIVDTLGRQLLPSYRARVALHEAGHFLIAYLIGVLPRTYTLSSLDAFMRFRRLNIQAGTQFCDGEFVAEVQSGKMSSSSLDRYSCVALAGVVTEYLRFDQAEGGLGDVQQLDTMFKALQFTQLKADGEVRWAVLNVASALRRYEDLHDSLAEAMQRGQPVGELMRLIDQQVGAKLELAEAAREV